MQTSAIPYPAVETAPAKVADRAARMPWFVYVVVFAAACIPIGALWDISWHSTIGRDTFWTPAHIMIYIGGAFPGTLCGWLVLKTSFFSTPTERAASVKYLGFHGPLGAWVAIWGALTMLVSAPFDNWWHDAYGLDVEILSPPHTLLALGMYAVAVGAALLALAWQNRGTESARRSGGRLFLFAMGVLLVMASIILTEESYPNAQHMGKFYVICCTTYAFYLSIASRASTSRWGATWSATIYMTIVAAMIWILPLFKARPLLAPIYLQVDHMVPPVFPFLLVLPAFGMDFASHKIRANDWLRAAVFGAVFFFIFLVAQWNFSEFLLTKHADNWFFAGGHQWPYFIQPSEWRDRFWGIMSHDWFNARSGTIALLVAMIASRFGLWIGSWMSRVQR